MAAPSLSRAALGAPRILGPPGAPRARPRRWSSGSRSAGTPPAAESPGSPGWDAPERAPQPLPKRWVPRAEAQYWHPLGPPTAGRVTFLGDTATGVPLPPRYSPRYVEAAWYQWWERGGVFSPSAPGQVPGGSPVLSLVLPPPNVTGSLHLGHALGVSLQDALVRWRRMQGWNVLWVPGTDHAGIATQAVVERWLWQHRGCRRQELGRDRFLREVWGWTERHGQQILQQLRALGPRWTGAAAPSPWTPAVASGRLRLVPKFHEKNWRTWMESAGDWCLSRQLWWGHRVPAYQVRPGPAPGPAPSPGAAEEGEGRWFVGRSEAEARAAAAGALGCSPRELHLQQDPDVLDTWFSSALFPFAALGWPEQGPDFGRFYPNSLLVTGSDLLFFWVARMVMLGQRLTGQLPFSQVLLHSLVRDPQGRKMSKSLGNVIDPRDVIGGATLQELQEKLQSRTLDPQELRAAQEGQRRQFPQGIPECGADALRLALITHNAHGPELRVGVASVLTQRRFLQQSLERAGVRAQAMEGWQRHPKAPRGGVSRVPDGAWLLSRLALAVAECWRRLEALEVHGAVAAVQSFWLRSFCDVYLEVAKVSLQRPELRAGAQATLAAGAELGLRLLAPFAPFVAEELWQRLPRARPAPPTLCRAPFPQPHALSHWRCPELEAQVSAMLELVRAVRGLRENFRVRGAARPPVLLQCPEPAPDWLEPLGPAFRTLSRAGPVELLPLGAEPGPGWAGAPAGSGTFVHLRIQAREELERSLEGPETPGDPKGTPKNTQGPPPPPFLNK
ncbi:LOW QUALITY PROTEIN: valine--tRNA ligase, mitochondrial-like [Ammospiza maritima maritima]